MRLDIGCGKNKRAGSVGIDRIGFPSVDVVLDVTKEPLSLDDSSVDEVFASHFLEHLVIEDIIRVIGEVHRVCKSGAVVEIRVPHFSGFTNFYEFHKTSFRYNSFREFTGGGMYESPVRFRRISTRISMVNRQNEKLSRYTKWFFWNYPIEWLVNKMPMFYELTGLRNLFPAWEIIFKLEVIK